MLNFKGHGIKMVRSGEHSNKKANEREKSLSIIFTCFLVYFITLIALGLKKIIGKHYECEQFLLCIKDCNIFMINKFILSTPLKLRLFILTF